MTRIRTRRCAIASISPFSGPLPVTHTHTHHTRPACDTHKTHTRALYQHCGSRALSLSLWGTHARTTRARTWPRESVRTSISSSARRVPLLPFVLIAWIHKILTLSQNEVFTLGPTPRPAGQSPEGIPHTTLQSRPAGLTAYHSQRPLYARPPSRTVAQTHLTHLT